MKKICENLLAISVIVILIGLIFIMVKPMTEKSLGAPINTITSTTNANFTCTTNSLKIISANSARDFFHIANSSTSTTTFVCLNTSCTPTAGIMLQAGQSWDMPSGVPYVGDISCTTSPSSSTAILPYSVNQ